MFLALWNTGYARGVGGCEQVVNALLRRFPAEHYETLLITNGNPGRKLANPFFPALPDRVALHVDTFPNPLLCRGPAEFAVSLFKYFNAAIRLVRSFRQRAPDIVHLHFVCLDVFLLILLKYLFGYRLVITFCGGDLEVTRRSALARLKVRTALQWADAVTTVSQEMADQLRHQFQARTVAWISNGVDHAELREAAATATPQVQPDHFVYVGRLHPDKRVPLLVQIFKESIDAGCDRNLYIIGDGEDREPVARLIAQHGLGDRINMLGAMTHQHALSALAKSRCLLLTSSEEGCPVVVLEAMALGVPVIGTRVGGVPNLVAHAETGYLFSPDDPAGAAQYVLRLARNPAEARSMGRRAADTARRRFDIATSVGAYVALYQSLLGNVESTPSKQLAAWPGIRSQ